MTFSMFLSILLQTAVVKSAIPDIPYWSHPFTIIMALIMFPFIISMGVIMTTEIYRRIFAEKNIPPMQGDTLALLDEFVEAPDGQRHGIYEGDDSGHVYNIRFHRDEISGQILKTRLRFVANLDRCRTNRQILLEKCEFV